MMAEMQSKSENKRRITAQELKSTIENLIMDEADARSTQHSFLAKLVDLKWKVDNSPEEAAQIPLTSAQLGEFIRKQRKIISEELEHTEIYAEMRNGF